MTDQTRPPTDHDDDVTSRRIPRPAPNARAETRPMARRTSVTATEEETTPGRDESQARSASIPSSRTTSFTRADESR